MPLLPLDHVEDHENRKSDRRVEKSDPPDGKERRDAIADPREAYNRQYVTFYLGDHYLGIEVEKVQEVFKSKEMTGVPLASSEIAGLINLRGHIIITLDLRKRLGFKEGSPQDEEMSIVVRTEDGQVNLLVDRIGGVIEVRPDLFEETPPTLDKRLAKVIKGIYKLKDCLLLALDSDLVTRIEDVAA